MPELQAHQQVLIKARVVTPGAEGTTVVVRTLGGETGIFVRSGDVYPSALSDDEVIKDIAREAVRRHKAKHPPEWKEFMADALLEVAETALRLKAEDFRQDDPVDPDLVEARECAALHWERTGYETSAAQIRRGEVDNSCDVQSAIIALKRGRELRQLELGEPTYDAIRDVFYYPLQKPDGWVEWRGGANPAPGRKVEIRMRGGAFSEVGPSNGLAWVHGLGDADIVAYRVIK